MLKFGGWMTITNVISPLMQYVDRFIIGSLLGMAAVAYYVTPYEMITKLLIIPGALVGGLFPAFSANYMADPSRTADLFNSGVRWIFWTLFPLVLLSVIFADNGLRLWLNEDFAIRSTLIMQWLAIGIFFNGLAYIPFAFIQSIGRPDITAKVHFVELPLYFIGLWAAMKAWGVEGAAYAWCVRVIVDAVILFVISMVFEKKIAQSFIREGCIIFISIIFVCLGSILTKFSYKTIYTICVLMTFGFVVWRYQLSANERDFVKLRFGLAKFFFDKSG